MAWYQEVRDTHTGAHGITQIGSNLNIDLGDPVQKRRNIQRWFAPWLFDDWPGRPQQSIIRGKGKPVEGCGSWLIEDTLPEWSASSQDCLWLCGDVGCGKSILCALTCRALRSDNTRFCMPAFFSFDADYTKESNFLVNTISALLCSLEPIPPELVKVHETHLTSSEVNDIEELILAVIRRLLTEKDSRYSSLVLVIDAIDEIPYEQQALNLELINRLVGLNNADTVSRLRVILFTRDDLRVQSLCQPLHVWCKKPIPLDYVRNDIRTAVRGRLAQSRLSKLSNERKETLISKIVSKADGMFRLAGLYVEKLIASGRRTVTSDHLEALLASFPGKLYEFYDEILYRISDGHVRYDAFTVLSWTMFAAGSFWLEDLTEACATLRGNDLFAKDSRSDCVELIEPLSGLVHVSPPLAEGELGEDGPQQRKHVVTLAHFSVREYLQQLDSSLPAMSRPFFSPREAQLYLTQACLAYLAHCFDDTTRTSKFNDYIMSEYAVRAWSYHAAAYFQEDQSQQFTRTTTDALSAKIKNCFRFPDIGLYGDAQLIRTGIGKIAARVVSRENLQTLLKEKTSIKRPSQTCSPSGTTSESAVSLEHPGHAEQQLMNLYSAMTPTSFRLLVLHPAKARYQPLRCSTLVDSSENKPRYSFLSYVWGGYNEPRRVIWLEGISVQILSNLHLALINIRDRTRPMVLWVDFLCVNLSDAAERNDQVQRMASRVEEADKSIVWLQRDEDAETELHISGDLGIQHLEGIEKNAEIQRAVEVFLGNGYWTRIWIRQEIIFAKNVVVYWGRQLIDWSFLLKVLKAQILSGQFHNSSWDVQRTVHLLLTIEDLRGRALAGAPSLDLEELLWSLRGGSASDPRDRIFALLIMMRDTPRLSGLPDYSLPYTEVYTRVARDIVQRCQGSNCDILSINNLIGYNDLWALEGDLPSWVPNWHGILYDCPLAPGTFDPRQPAIYSSGGVTACTLRSQPAGRGLLATAIQVDRITWCTPVHEILQPFHGKENSEDLSIYEPPRILLAYSSNACIDLLRALLEDRYLIPANGTTGFQPWLNSNAVHGDLITPHNAVFERLEARDLKECLFMDSQHVAIIRGSSRAAIIREIRQRGNREQRMICRTAKDSIGNVPQGAREGDLVVVLLGSRVPHVVRPYLDGFQLIGECYLQGYMDGEAVELCVPGILTAEDIALY